MISDLTPTLEQFRKLAIERRVIPVFRRFLADTLRLLHTSPTDGMPPFTSGMVGYLSYDAVRRVERLPDTNPRDLDIPELAFLLASDLAVLDHHDGQVWLVANAINFDATDERVDEAYADAVARVEQMAAALAQPTPSAVVSTAP